MSIDLYVERSPGDREAPQITDPLITTVDIAIARGAREIEDYAHKKLDRLTIVAKPGLRRGVIIKVIDALQGKPWYGKIHAVSISQVGVECTASLEVYRLL